ncbi:hypothetical protein FB639_005228, partial [Coemansia asiatica]
MDNTLNTEELPGVSAVDDFGLVDYDSPMPQENTIEETTDQSPSVAAEHADELIDFVEDDDDELEEALVQGSGELSVSSVKDDNDEQDYIKQKEEQEELAQVIGSSSSSSGSSDDEELESVKSIVDLTQDVLVQNSGVPETWVYCDGHWMVYLGPSQASYSKEMQRTLMDMPVDQLIHWMHSEIMLRDDDDLALEFPSLALVIDQ